MTAQTLGGPGQVAYVVPFVATTQTRHARGQLQIAADQWAQGGGHTLSMVRGQPGVGKTTLVEQMVDLNYRQQGHAVIQLQLSSVTTPNEIASRTLRTIGGDPRGTNPLLLERIVDLLEDRRCVFLLDEAHHLSDRGVRDLKLLFDRLPAADIIVCGAANLPYTLERVPELYARVGTRVTVEPLPLDEAFAVLPHYHQLYQGAEQDLITQVDRGYAKGLWRSWHNFTVKAAMIGAQVGQNTLDHQLLALTFAAIGVPGIAAPGRTKKRARAR